MGVMHVVERDDSSSRGTYQKLVVASCMENTLAFGMFERMSLIVLLGDVVLIMLCLTELDQRIISWNHPSFWLVP